MNKLLIIAPHMDNESLSCGGLILQGAYDEVHILIPFGRVYDYGRVSESDLLSLQYEHLEDALKVLSVPSGNCTVHNLKEGEPQSVGYYSLLEIIETELSTFQPDTIVIPGADSLNQYHRHLHDVCKIALRPANRSGVDVILCATSMDGSTGTPNFFIPMKSDTFAQKMEAVKCYKTEIKDNFHPRTETNMYAAHKMWGSQCGEAYAEAYTVYYSKGVAV